MPSVESNLNDEVSEPTLLLVGVDSFDPGLGNTTIVGNFQFNTLLGAFDVVQSGWECIYERIDWASVLPDKVGYCVSITGVWVDDGGLVGDSAESVGDWERGRNSLGWLAHGVSVVVPLVNALGVVAALYQSWDAVDFQMFASFFVSFTAVVMWESKKARLGDGVDVRSLVEAETQKLKSTRSKFLCGCEHGKSISSVVEEILFVSDVKLVDV